MKKLSLVILLLTCYWLAARGCNNPGHHHAHQQKGDNKDYPIQPVAFTSVKFSDKFWAPRIRINQDVTIPIALGHCYNTGRVDNFKKAGKLMPGYFATQLTFDDTDIYKIIEGAAYSIQMFPNKELEARMDTLIYYIQKAQEPDGYLYTARTAGEPGKLHEWVGEKRWEKDPDLSHELYNCGHLYEAAVAHYQATGKRSLLDVAIKNADLLVKDFGPGKLAYEPGHQIVEMGLAKMYRVTGKKEYLDLAKYFLDLKGYGHSGEYSQTHKPVIEQDEAVGHAVRAAYMYSGMADVAALTGNEAYLHAIDKIWDNVVTKKLYITGGIGATGHGEAFGKNYELPNMSAYCETCAAIANVYWNHRLFLLHGDSKYYDVLERTLYNGLISGINLDGNHFFYPNPLESVGQHGRSEWFGCACCPSNVCRFMPSIPGYVYAKKDDKIYVSLFVESEGEIELGKNKINLSQKTGYPWDGNVTINVDPAKSEKFDVLVRIPGWALNKPVPSDLYTYLNPKKEAVKIKVNGKDVDYTIGSNGYVTLSQKWKKGDKIDLSFPMDVHKDIANEKVEDDRGKVAIERGPVVYCLEWVDNKDRVLNAVLEDNVVFTEVFLSDKLSGIMQLEANAKSASRDKDNNVIIEDKRLTAIPYYAWSNRGSGEMAVWIPRTVESTRPLPPPTFCTNAKVSASSPNKSMSSVNDGYWPKDSNDRHVPFFTLWPKNNSQEWIVYDFDKPETFSTASVFWYDDGPWGGCRIPLSWGVQYKNDKGEWVDVRAKTPAKPEKNALNTMDFEPVTSQSVRLLFQLPVQESAGVYEFEVK
ncbi:glycoside hydrolase family 127 protein [Dysgonomonas termitidis]|uniref:Beta-L-arabinofuranosidase domain-containing protein n=1 Tax=Dysgonomonas termitidis TaxID=1516126 RepID=A0ABV9KTJ8_9BACT